MKFVIIVTPSHAAGTEIGYRIPFEILRRTETLSYRIVLEFNFQRGDLIGADVLILYRCLRGRTLSLADYARKKGIRVMYELDDDLLDPPEDEPWGLRHRQCGQPQMIRRFLETVDLVKAGSSVLAERIRCGGIQCIYQPYAVRVREKALCERVPPYRIGYFGTPHHQKDIASILPALQAIETEFLDLVEFEFWGCVPEEWHHLKKVRVAKFNTDYEGFLDTLSEREWTIGLAPLRPTRFNEAKSNSKFRDYAAAGIPAIYADMPPYRDCVVHGQNGWVCGNNPTDWVCAIREALQNRERFILAANARSYVNIHHNPQTVAENWGKLLNDEVNEKWPSI